ncbi:MAG: hypothetical protein MUF24_08390 [Chitinophagaceae bacterium]|nr:hypothetical protein [Chitinophagaceae bacterium]
MALQKIDRLLYRIMQAATARMLWLSLALYIIMAAVMGWGAAKMNDMAGQKIEILDLQPGYTPQQAKNILSNYNDQTLRFAAIFNLTADTLYPLAYTALFCVILARFCRKIVPHNPQWRWLLIIPLPIPLIDYLENAGIIQILWNYPEVTDNMISLASFFTLLKWSLVGLTVLGIGLAAVLWLKTKRNKA